MPSLTPSHPVIRPNKRGFGWYVDEPVTLAFDQRRGNGHGFRIVQIPKGYTFDGHSVPRIFWGIFPPVGRDVYAALAHDYLYQYAKTLRITRADADATYTAFMNDPLYRLSRTRSSVFPLAVRLFGWAYFYWGRK